MSRVFAVVVGLALLGGNVWLGWRRPSMRPMAVMYGAIGFQCLWAGLAYGRGAVMTVPVVAVPAFGLGYLGWAFTRERRRRRRPLPASAPPSPGP